MITKKTARLYKACFTVAGTKRMKRADKLSIPNQDSYYIEYTELGNQSGFLALVADGMGGEEYQKSEVASGYIRQSLAEWYNQVKENLFSMELEEIKKMLNTEIQAIHKTLIQNADRKGILYGSTLTAVLVINSKLIVAQVGDSRCYLNYHNYIRQLTEDQTLYQQTLKKKKEVPEELLVKTQSTLLQCIGQREVKPHFYSEILPPEYEILLCSDGFYRKLLDKELTDVFLGEGTLDKRLERAAGILVERGERDDITAILIKRVMEDVEVKHGE